MGHKVVIYKNKDQQQRDEAQVVDQEEDDQLFIVTCFTSYEISENWFIDSGCTNHMTHDKELFKELKSTESKKVRIGNGEYIAVKGKDTVAIASCSGTKLITDVLYVPDIDQRLLSVGQLIEKGFKVMFMEKACVIEDAIGQKMFEVNMARSFSLNPIHEEQEVFGSFLNESSEKHAHSLEVSLINEGNEGHATVKSLNEKLYATLLDVAAKKDLIKQHAKVTEEAISGQETAEAELTALKQQLEASSLKKSLLEDRINHLEEAIKECVRQLRQSREEQEQKLQDAILLMTVEWESKKSELEKQLKELHAQLETAKTEAYQH